MPPVQAGGHPARFHEASNANAALAITSGLAESVPVLNLPFSGGDMVVLTKHHGFMVYKLEITCGAVQWQDHLLAFGGIFGTGFVWRQLARRLVGLTPVGGLLPKIADAYAGTVVVGEVAVRWYTTGRKMSAREMRQHFEDAVARGTTIAREKTGAGLDRQPVPERGTTTSASRAS